MAGPDYVILAADLKTGNIRDEIPFDTFVYGHTLNASGAFQGTISVRHSKATRDNLDPSRTLIHVLRDGVCLWSGIHWTALPDVGSQDQLQIDGEGHYSYFAGPGGQTSQGRFLKVDKVYTNADQLAIAQDVIAWAQAQGGGDLGIVVGSETSGVDITATYLASDRHNIGAIISDLATAAGGFDFSFDTSFASGSPVTTMRLWYPGQGRTETDFVFELGTNISQLQQSLDGTLQANDVDFTGQDAANNPIIGSASDPAALDSYPLLESVQQSPATGSTTATILAAQASSYLASVDNPVETLPSLTLTVTPELQPGDWTIGDYVRVIARDGYIDFDDSFRIVADQITVDAQGSEQVQISFQPATTFA